MKKRAEMVGPAGLWEKQRKTQISFLKDVGLLPSHTLLDVGCGVLRGGVPLIDYLDKGKYYGFEPSRYRLDEGKLELQDAGLSHKTPHLSTSWPSGKFDYVWAFQVVIHMDEGKLDEFLSRVRLSKNGACYFTIMNEERKPLAGWCEYPTVWKKFDYYKKKARAFGFDAELVSDKMVLMTDV